MSFKFYDKVAKKFGGYDLFVKYTSEYPNGNPEKVFKDKLMELSGKDKIVLDIGCADGRFTLSMAPYFQRIYAIDLSTGMLKSANRHKEEQGIENVIFELQDAGKTSFKDAFFDVIYSRRGPDFYREFYRLLKPDGHFLQIGIGERDAMELKKMFGRGQGYGSWDRSELKKVKEKLGGLGFEILYAKEFLYDEYYPRYEDLNLFLQGVPIFEDFDSKRDKKYLESYSKKFQTKKGIRLPRHRIVVVAKK